MALGAIGQQGTWPVARLGCWLATVTVALSVSGCETFRLFGDYKAVESERVADAPYPRLIDVPVAPPPGSYSAAVPDPSEGIAVEVELGSAAARAERRREAAAGPVISEEDRAVLDKARTARKTQRRSPILTPQERAELRRKAQARRP